MNILKLIKPTFSIPRIEMLKKLKNTKNNPEFLIQRINHPKDIYI